MKNKQIPKDVDSYITQAPKEIQATLTKLRQEIIKAAPKAHEKISYGMPFYEYGGSGFKSRLIYFGLSKNYIAVYLPPTRAGKSLELLKDYQVTRASFHFPLDKPFPFELIGKIVREIVEK
ncbi:DUF1801 domain-containing protein [Patescibacteria group bacterium]|nr:DUF1801 domain-containing protein [Patescibacteria group bacterium]MCL5410162.1 DUF1801 domain-containing protein [Patescibacteria group bacterium]